MKIYKFESNFETPILSSVQVPDGFSQQYRTSGLGANKIVEDAMYRNNNQYSNDGIDFSLDRIDSNDMVFLKKLAQIESGGNPNIRPNKYGYEGLFQFRYRPGDDGYKYAQKLGVSIDQIRQNPTIQYKIMDMALKDYDKQLQGAGIPVNNLTRWLRHNQGLQGAKWILSGKMTPLLHRNISTNLPKGIAPTINNYLSYWSKKWKI